MDISARIRELRNEQGISQEQLAIKVGVSRQAVTKWETGAGAPDIENLATLARVFGVTVDEILNGGAATTATSAYESVTSLDLEQEKNYDIEVGCARRTPFVDRYRRPCERCKGACGHAGSKPRHLREKLWRCGRRHPSPRARRAHRRAVKLCRQCRDLALGTSLQHRRRPDGG